MYVCVCVHCNDFLSAPRDLGSCTFGLIAHRGKELNSITPWRVLKNIYEFLHDWCLSIFLRFFFLIFSYVLPTLPRHLATSISSAYLMR